MDFLLKGYQLAKEYGNKLGLHILFGVEVTLVSTHSDYLVFGINEDFLFQHEKLYEYSLSELYDVCHKNNYLLVQAHPFRDNILLAPLEYIDGIEVFNGCHDEVSRNELALEYGKKSGKIKTSGSDFHHDEDLAKGGLATLEEITNIEQLVKVLKTGNYELIQNGVLEKNM